MEWISVDDKPLDGESNILVITEHHWIANVYFNEWKWWIETFGGLFIELDDKITHWMPLPDHPGIEKLEK